jgi:hypothetical protein
MSPHEVMNDIQKLITVLTKQDLVIDSNRILSISLPNSCILISPSHHIGLSEVFGDFGTLDEYLWFLEKRFVTVHVGDAGNAC